MSAGSAYNRQPHPACQQVQKPVPPCILPHIRGSENPLGRPWQRICAVQPRLQAPEQCQFEPTAQVARDYELNLASLHPHRPNCLKLGSSNAIMKDVARGTAAVALLPSKEVLSGAYFELRERIDQIVAQAQQEGSLSVAVSGLNSIRQTLDSLARLAGHDRAGGTQVNVAEIAYRVDPVLWVREAFGISAYPWQQTFLRGDVLLKAGAKFKSDNVYGLELDSGSRVLALPSSDDSIRGMTVDAWIVADEAARLPDGLIAALRPMRARRPEARFAMLSTAWNRTDPFWTAWSSDDPTWIRLKATADANPELFIKDFLEQERRAMGEHDFNREYLGIPGGGQASPFSWDLFDCATQIHVPLVPLGPAFRPPAAAQPVPVANPFQTVRVSGGVP